MYFFDRFVRVPIKIHDVITGNPVKSFLRLNPFDIEVFKSTIDTDFMDEDCMFIGLKSGRGYIVILSEKEFERKVNQHYRQLEDDDKPSPSSNL